MFANFEHLVASCCSICTSGKPTSMLFISGIHQKPTQRWIFEGFAYSSLTREGGFPCNRCPSGPTGTEMKPVSNESARDVSSRTNDSAAMLADKAILDERWDRRERQVPP